ncbi:hypothetical protein ATCC90586_004167 [Pythium insidiosum]|nr:hypothetical protein ATCC90586_004167 [Pythium insidiosum]
MSRAKAKSKTPSIARLNGPSERGTCASCCNIDSLVVLRAAPCGHLYCAWCLRRMARLALQDRALVPVRCCRIEFPIEYVHDGLSRGDEFERYQRLLAERPWRSTDLVSDAEYSRVVAAHGGKQCPGCGIGVLRDYGCVHMKCPNGHEFCFTCLSPWGGCSCQLIPQHELDSILRD